MLKILYFLNLFILIGCIKASNEKDLKVVNRENNKGKNTLIFTLESPARKCNHVVSFASMGQGEIIYSRYDRGGELEVRDKRSFAVAEDADLKKLQEVMLSITSGKETEGKFWNDGWHYIVSLGDNKKVDVYRMEDSEYVQVLYTLITKYSPLKVDKSCF